MSATALQVAWPLPKLGEAVVALARRAGLPARDVEMPEAPPEPSDGGTSALEPWLEGAAEWLGLEAEPVFARYADVESVLQHGGPALLCFRSGERTLFLAVLRGGGGTVTVVDPSWRVQRIRLEVLRKAFCEQLEERALPQVDRCLERAKIPESRRDKARRALLADLLADTRLAGCWLLRLPPSAPLRQQLVALGLGRRLATIGLAHAVEFGLLVLGWWLIGRGALEGRLEAGWLVAWSLVLISAVPARLVATRVGAVLSVDVGALAKQRLLVGAQQLEPDEVRHAGAGQHFSRVLESEALEVLALSGGLMALLSLVQLALTIPVLAVGAGGAWHVAWFIGWIVVTLLFGWWHYKSRDRWTDERLDMTHDLVERMVGHRTRLAQERARSWHSAEDQVLERYLQASRTTDRAATLTTSLVAKGWLLVGILSLAPAFVAGSASPALIAVAIGGVLSGALALSELSMGIAAAMGAAIAWKRIGPMFQAAERKKPPEVPRFALTGEREDTGVALEATDLVFRYPSRTTPVLSGCTVKAQAGERILVEGPSGCGKSTLGALLAGLRQPDAGLVLLGGLDLATLGGAAWRQRVACVPQFHDNHILTGTVAFNLLMGKRWPPEPGQFDRAEEICRELELGPVLDRMPSGLQQMVGETGWRLSHGERSRLCIARALLQDAEVLILDESFAALDPDTLERALGCVLRHARTLVVIAHP